MKKLLLNPLIWLLAISTIGCVPARKYEELKTKYNLADEERNSQKSRAITAESELTEVKAKKEELEKYRVLLEADTASLVS